MYIFDANIFLPPFKGTKGENVYGDFRLLNAADNDEDIQQQKQQQQQQQRQRREVNLVTCGFKTPPTATDNDKYLPTYKYNDKFLDTQVI